jgi:DNA-binding NarL/FixJ family response regulator
VSLSVEHVDDVQRINLGEVDGRISHQSTKPPLGLMKYTPRGVYVRAVTSSTPILVALVDDYDVVLTGVAAMLDPYRDRVLVAEIDANKPLHDEVDVALYDSFAQPESDHAEIRVLVDNPRARRVVVYTWNFHPDLIDSARQRGAHGYLSKTLPARDLVTALEAVHAGETVISDPPSRARPSVGHDWPGRREGLTDREAEILALITQGKNNAEVAALTFLSPNTIKSYIRTIYRKIGAASRTQAVLWGVKHGFEPDHHRIDHWRGGP